MRDSDTVKPLALWQSVLMFGLPGVVAAGAHYLVWPGLEGLGLSSEDAYYLATMIVFVGLLIATAVGLRLEGTPGSWEAIRQRLRLNRMGRRDWAWMLGGTVVYAILALASTQIAMERMTGSVSTRRVLLRLGQSPTMGSMRRVCFSTLSARSSGGAATSSRVRSSSTARAPG